jgi:hypothetical protein
VRSRRGRDEVARWRLLAVALLGAALRLVIVGYVAVTVWLLATGGFDGWW